MEKIKFTDEVIEKLKYYVYRLIDPRNGQTFYVGKGKGNRVFAHIDAEVGTDGDSDEISDKIQLIRDIKLSGFETQHVVHRHGMDEATALQVEAALIDAYPGLTNIAGGHGNDAFGVMHSQQIINIYAAREAILEDNVILININDSSKTEEIYEAVRYAWRVNSNNANKCKYALAVVRGIIKEVFLIKEWLEATDKNFPGRPTREGRWGFRGELAEFNIRDKYKNKRLPDNMRHTQNPIRYFLL